MYPEVLNQDIFLFEEADYFNAAMKNLFQKGKSFKTPTH